MSKATKVNKDYDESIQANTKALVETAKLDKTTAHAALDSAGLTFPEGISLETLNNNIRALNDIAISVEQAGYQLTTQAHKDNDKILTTSATLNLGEGIVVNTQTYLQQELGDSGTVFGQAVTAVDHRYNSEQSAYLDQMRASNQAEAKKLFG